MPEHQTILTILAVLLAISTCMIGVLGQVRSSIRKVIGDQDPMEQISYWLTIGPYRAMRIVSIVTFSSYFYLATFIGAAGIAIAGWVTGAAITFIISGHTVKTKRLSAGRQASEQS